MKFLERYSIPFFVFITGACVLVIEVLAIRVLAPYFGNTMFAVSSVLSVVLAALSAGYYVGGKFADKHPEEKFFYAIISFSGICTIVLHVFGVVFLALFGYQLSIFEGPLISSIALFFGQSFLLGMLSPFAIVLQAKRQGSLGVGSNSGLIFFWSTLGSIAGSLATGFFLIPHFGINTIMIGTGVVLLALGILPLLFRKQSAFLGSFFMVVAITLGVAINTILPITFENNVVYARDGLYQRIVIHDGIYKAQSARFLLQDRNLSAVEFINKDKLAGYLAADYTRYYALYQIFTPNVKEALMIGGGAYSVPKALLNDLPNVNINVAEIEPSLFQITQQYFNVPTDTRLNNVVMDGRRFLYDSDKKYDMIFSDAYSSFYSTPEHLTTKEFFETAKDKLSDNGIFMANVIGNLDYKGDSFLFSEIKTFKSVFPNSYFFAVNSVDSKVPQNIIFVGYNSSDQINLASQSIGASKNPVIAGLNAHKIDVNALPLDSALTLTDNYAPVEYLIAKELQAFKY